MAKTLEQILGWVFLTGLVKSIKTGIPDVLPGEFWNTTKDTLMDQGRYTQVTGTRRTSRRVEYGAPALNRNLRDVASYDVKLMHTFEMIQLDVKQYQSLRGYTNYNVQDFGQQEVERQALEFRAYFDNLEKATLYSTLANMAIWFDGNGNLLPSSAGAVVTISYNPDANHQNQLNGIIIASWNSPTTDIPLAIRLIQKQSALDTGYVLENVFYGVNLPSYFAINQYCQPFLARSPAMREKFLDTGEIPQGLFGIKNWHPVYTAFFQDNNGVNQQFFNVDNLILTPKVDQIWYDRMLGTYPVPTSFQPQTQLTGTMNSFEIVQGMFGYGVPIANPMTAQMFFGHTFLPIVKFPDAIFQAIVTP
jgi:hypothetical protein